MSSTAVTRLGSPGERERVFELLGVAFNIPKDERKRPDVLASLNNAMNECILYGLVPNRDCYMVPFKTYDREARQAVTKYTFMISVHGLRQFRARREALEGKKFDIQFRDMTPDEIRNHLEDEQADGAVGVEATWIDFDVAKQYRELGLQYRPRTYCGFWQKNAKLVDEWSGGKKTGQQIWQSDPVQTARTKRDVAERRAERMALLANITPTPLVEYDESKRELKFIQEVESQVREQQIEPPVGHDAMLIDGAGLIETDDGLMFYDEPQAQGEPEPEPNVPDMKMVLDRLRELDQNGKVPVAGLYRRLAGAVDEVCGIDGCHNGVLEYLLGREPIDKTHPPSAEVCDYILRKILPETKDKSGNVAENPTFDIEFTQAISELAQSLAN